MNKILSEQIEEAIENNIWANCTGRYPSELEFHLNNIPEAAKAIEVICRKNAIAFANFLLKSGMSPNGFGGWGNGKINVNYHGSASKQLYKLFNTNP